MKPLRFAVIGTGFWANYQIAAWKELEGVELVALHDREKAKAESLAQKFKVASVYDDVEKLFKSEKLDFVDIITDVDTHASLTALAAKNGVPVICQKPMAPKFNVAKQMVKVCHDNGVPFFIHENFRWQAPIRKLKEVLDVGTIGKVFKARVTFCSAFPVFDNQPFLAALDEFILTDIGSHTLDICRFLFGEAETLLCHTDSVNQNIQGEDVANVLMKMQNGISCYAEMSYASILEYEPFPQTFILVEGAEGSIHLTKDYQLRITSYAGTDVIKEPPKMYPWVDPKYALVHSSIVDCNRDILNGLTGKSAGETTGEDNLETVKLVHASYASARNNRLIHLNQFV